MPLAEVLAAFARLGPVRSERLTPLAVIGCVLAEDLVGVDAVPAGAIARRAGYAVRSSDTIGGSPYGPVRLDRMPIRVAAGDPLPERTDAVVPHDMILLSPGFAEIVEPVEPGHWARRRGEDVGAGVVLRPRGATLRATDAAVAMAAGISTCTIRRPRLAVLDEGDARFEPAIALVAAAAGRWGASLMRRSGNDPMIDHEADLVLLAEPDPNRAVERIAAAGGEILALGLALRPGDATVVGLLEDMPIVTLDGDVASAFAIMCAFITPLLDRMSGAGDRPSSAPKRLARKLVSTVGLSELALLRRVGDGLEPIAIGDLPLSALSRAEHWCVVPPDSEGWPADAHISVEDI